MKKVEINEEMVWIWKCPYCGKYTRMWEEPDIEDFVVCKYCGKTCEVK